MCWSCYDTETHMELIAGIVTPSHACWVLAAHRFVFSQCACMHAVMILSHAPCAVSGPKCWYCYRICERAGIGCTMTEAKAHSDVSYMSMPTTAYTLPQK